MTGRRTAAEGVEEADSGGVGMLRVECGCSPKLQGSWSSAERPGRLAEWYSHSCPQLADLGAD